MRIGEQSVSDDSQPSLLLENVLRRRTPMTKAASSVQDPCRASPSSTIGANLRTAAPRYHFHGLADTQTNSQPEESQLPPGLTDPVLTSTSPDKPTTESTKDIAQSSKRVENTNDFSTPRSLSPHNTRVTRGRDDVKRISRYAPQRRDSLSPVSQDSFAGPLPSRGRTKANARDPGPSDVFSNKLDESQDSVDDRSSSVVSSIFRPRNRSQSTEPLRNQHNESQSHGLIDDSIYGDMPFAQGQDPEAMAYHYEAPPPRAHSPASEHSSSAPSSSYLRLLDGHRDDALNRHTPDVNSYPETQTQPSTPVATQPTSDQQSQPSAYHDNPVFKPDPSHVEAASILTGSSATTGRGLLGLVDPAKQWRLQAYIKQQQATISATQHNTSGVATFGDTDVGGDTQMVDETPARDESQMMEETQPTEETQPSEEPFVYPRRQLPPAQPSAATNSHVESSAHMEVIPDSEPDDAASPRRSPSHTPVADTRMKFRALSVSTVSEGESSTIPGLAVPDNILSSVASLRQEVEESSDEDTPLAVTIGIKPVSKASKPSSSKAAQEPVAKMLPPPTSKRVATATGARRLPNITVEQVHNRSWDTTVIPSSEPNESVAQVAQPPATPIPPTGEIIRQTSKPTSKPSSSHPQPKGKVIGSTSTLNSVTPARRFSTHSTVATDVDDVDSDVAMPPPSDTVDQVTEIGDEDAMDVESDYELQNTRSRKRRRVASTTKVKKEQKSATKRKASPTPSRAPKRIKSEPDTTQPTRVFALWKDENNYYSGVIQEISKTSSKRFLVKFDDGDSDWIDLSKIRLCQLKPEDHILFEHTQSGVVMECDGSGPNDTVTISISGTTQEVKIKALKIAGRSIVAQWKDRTLNANDIVPVIRPKSAKPSPAPSRMSLASAGSTKSIRSRVLGRTGFVVTNCPGNDRGDQDKNKAMQSVKLSGGQVFDEWSNIFKMEGKMTQNGKRWVINDKDVTTVKLEVDRVFLLADQFNHKPKFLMALALGIPCLSFKWLDACIREQQDVPWYPYLLPAGMSEILDARVSQFVDLDWGNSPAHLTDIMSYNVPPKVFRGKSLLCLSVDYLPKTTKTKASVAKESNSLVPRILLCMGASRVEAVADARYASHSLDEYDYVIVKEESDVGTLRIKRINAVHFGWVKECLVASRILEFDWE